MARAFSFSAISTAFIMAAFSALIPSSSMAADATSQNGVVRVCIPPAPWTAEIKKLTDGDLARLYISVFFRERLASLPGVEAMDEDWADAVSFFCGQDMTGSKSPPSLGEIRALAPADAALLLREDGGNIECTILSEKGAVSVSAPANRKDPAAWIKAVSERMGPALGLDAKAAAALGDCGGLTPQMLDAYLVSQRLKAAWVYNSGESRLDCLRPFVQDIPKHPMLAAAFLRAGTVLSTDTRKPESPKKCVEMLRIALLAALGTASEDEAVSFVRQTVHGREEFEKELLGIVSAAGKDEADNLLEGIGKDGEGLVAEEPRKGAQEDPSKAAGAIRCLAAMNSAKLKKMLPRLAANPSAPVRAAAAFALAVPENGPAAPLEKLAADKEPEVSFAAHYALWRRGGNGEAGLAAARRLFDSTAPKNIAVEEFIAGAGTKEDEPRLRSLLAGKMAERRIAVKGLARLGALTAEDCRALLRSADDALLSIVLKSMNREMTAACRDALVAIANGVYAKTAESARRSLRAERPSEPQEQLAFDLAVEHLYLRLSALDKLAKIAEPWAAQLIEKACGNSDPQIRAQALMTLNAKSPEAALKILPGMLKDTSIWVRIHASSLAASLKSPALKDPVAAALAAETDSTCRIYLEAAQGKPMPKPVNNFKPGISSFGICGYSTYAAESPFEWYYNLNTEVKEPARKAHDAGKIMIGRTNTVAGNPVQIIFHPVWRDRWWTNLRKELTDIRHLDGVVIGEESMYSQPWSLWDDGWRCFCADAGIDAEKVDGDRTKLGKHETLAYLDWEQERAIDGFNRMYDFIKLDQGAQRPGFLVGTYMPDQNGPSIAEHRWKFDVGGAYWYQCGNYTRYNMVRRYRTVWPGRRMIYLVSGNAGLPVLADVNYKLKVPEALVLDRTCNAYADSLCVWAAGGDPGYFVAWLFMGKDVKPGPKASGVWVWVEDMAENSEVFKKGLDNVWAGVAAQYRLDAEIKDVKGTGPGAKADGAAGEDAGKGDELEEARPEEDEFSKRAAADRERFRLGMFLEQKALYDIARAFIGMPAPQENFTALLVGDRSALPQFAALGGHDKIELLNLIPRCRLKKYRIVGIQAKPEDPLRDETIAALRSWLEEQPGLLYIAGFLSTDKTNEASTAADHDGILKESWPWEPDIVFEKDRYALKGKAAKPLDGDNSKCTKALWRADGFKGAVLFDCGKTDALEFKEIVNRLHRDHGVGFDDDAVPGMFRAGAGGLAACVSGGNAAAEVKMPGLDIYTGEADPVVAKKRSAAITADDYRGRYVASYNGVTILCDKPIEDVKAVPGGLEVKCPGLMRASAVGGNVRLAPELPARQGAPEAILKWILFGSEDGSARIAGGPAESVFVRSSGYLAITATAK